MRPNRGMDIRSTAASRRGPIQRWTSIRPPTPITSTRTINPRSSGPEGSRATRVSPRSSPITEHGARAPQADARNQPRRASVAIASRERGGCRGGDCGWPRTAGIRSHWQRNLSADVGSDSRAGSLRNAPPDDSDSSQRPHAPGCNRTIS